MGKITKTASSKHESSLSPAISEFIKSATEVPLSELPRTLSTFSTRWPYPRGDLYNWIEPLNRFDQIIEDFNNHYGLSSGVQTRPFGVSLLLEGCMGIDVKELQQQGFGSEGDRELIQSILRFTRLLLEKCGNRVLFNGGDRLNDLLNTTSLSLLQCTLRVGLCLAQRYRDRFRPFTQMPPTPVHYGLGLEKIQQLTAAVPQPPAMSSRQLSTSPVKTTKGKDKHLQSTRPRRGSTVCSPNDFRSLCREDVKRSGPHKQTQTSKSEWQDWATVRLALSPMTITNGKTHANGDSSDHAETPDRPIPARRRSVGPANSRLSHASTSEEAGQPSSTSIETQTKTTDLHKLEIHAKDLMKSDIHETLQQNLAEIPATAQYEFLHKLRVAYGLVTSSESRKLVLSVRLLAMANLACVSPEDTFLQKLLGHTYDAQPRQQLLQQLVSLLLDSDKARTHVPVWIQANALDALGAMARQKLVTADVCSAMQVGSAHGVLFLLTQRAAKDLEQEDDTADDVDGDEWRDVVFAMLKYCMESSAVNGRLNESFVSPALVSVYANTLTLHTNKAMRIHLRVTETFKTLNHLVKDGLTILSSRKVFENMAELFHDLTKEALELCSAGSGMPQAFKTPNTDYEIPYVHQQILRSCIDLISDIGSQQNTQADRILRSLIDSPKLLTAFRIIVNHGEAYGPHTWSEVVKCVCGFLHNEPTSYTVLAEAGLPTSILHNVTQEEPQGSLDDPGPGQKSTDNEVMEDATPVEASTSMKEQPNNTAKKFSPVPQKLPQGIFASSDAMMSVVQAFGAICLTNAGLQAFRTSNALAKFFEVFESPAHVKVLKNGNVLSVLGNTFDELVRHHPELRESVLSAAMIAVARIRFICRSKAWEIGAGPKLWTSNGQDAVSGHQADLLLEISPPLDQTSSLELPDGSILLPEPQWQHEAPSKTSEIDNEGLQSIDYMSCIMGFIAAFFENQTLCGLFVEAGGADLVLDFLTLSTTPVVDLLSATRTGNFDLGAVVHMMAETKPHLVLPVLVQRALYAAEQLDHFVQNQPQGVATYFAPLLKHDDVNMDDSEADYVQTNGTRIVKALTALHSLVQTLTEVFNVSLYGSRSSIAALFGQVNLADMYAALCAKISPISAACIRESITLQRVLPEAWLRETRPHTDTPINDEVKNILGLQTPTDNDGTGSNENPTNPGDRPTFSTTAQTGNETNNGTGSVDAATSDSAAIAGLRDTPSFKNAQTLRHLTLEVPNGITSLLGTLGRALVGKRRIDAYQKQNVFHVARAIAEALRLLLNPPALRDTLERERKQCLEVRFAYLVVVLDAVNSIILDLYGIESDQVCQSVTSVLLAFEEVGGMQVLHRIGIEFFDQLKSCEVASDTIQLMTSANSGLKICLEILDGVTSAPCIVDTMQSVTLKSSDPTRPFYFVPAQLLLVLRLHALPLARLIWESEYAQEASKVVIERLIAILKHVLDGDQEAEAVKNADSIPLVTTHSAKKMSIDETKVAALTAQGFDRLLAMEAMFRCNGVLPNAQEYCCAFRKQAGRQRCPLPPNEVETKTESGPSGDPPSLTGALDSGMDPALVQVLNSLAEGVTSSNNPPGSSGDSGSSAMSINNILNQDPGPEDKPVQRNAQTTPELSGSDARPRQPTVEKIHQQREFIRGDLAEQCHNILNTHQQLTFELSELIMSATKRITEDAAKSFREESSALLINALLSLQTEDQISETEGKRIEASAHFNALLLQDKATYESAEPLLEDAFDQLLRFIGLSNADTRSAGESFPWVGSVLLIFEKMLSRDAEPDKIEWRYPADLEASDEPRFSRHEVFNLSQKQELFRTLMDMLLRVGKDKTLAISVMRILVILTRTRDIASTLAQKRNLQRLFVMVKGLAGATDERFQSSFMIVLRHIVEDEETLRQIMKTEIQSHFRGRPAPRSIDTGNFIRDIHHVVLRSPELFVDVANEVVKIQRHDGRDRHNLVLRTNDDQQGTQHEAQQGNDNGDKLPGSPHTASGDVLESSIEPHNEQVGPSVPPEIKVPTVEHPDGVVHFLLSELLAYKEVEDKDVTPGVAIGPEQSVDHADTDESRDGSLVPGSPGGTPAPPALPTQPAKSPTKGDKMGLKAEDHPIYIYRCFLLQCLTELLLSYNRTKVEFINFSRKADPMSTTPSKPRSVVVNYLLNNLIPTAVEPEDTLAFKKKTGVSNLAMKLVVGLCAYTAENKSFTADRYPLIASDDQNESELVFVRRFVLEHAIKSFKDASTSSDIVENRFSRLLGLADLFRRLISNPRDDASGADVQTPTQKALARMMFEKNFISILTLSLADIELTLPGAKRVIRYILRPLKTLTSNVFSLSLDSETPITSALGTSEDDDLSSATSVSELANDSRREETPDLFRNSALGMQDPGHPHETSSESEDDNDEEMYDEEYHEEMEYDEEMAADPVNNGEVVSEDEDDAMGGVGPIEGVSGDVPMGFEFVVNGNDHNDMDAESDEDDENSSSDSRDDDDTDEEEEDETEEFDIGEDDEDMGGEINGDEGIDSMEEVSEDEEEWGDDGVEGEQDADPDDNIILEAHRPSGGEAEGEGPAAELNNLLQVLNGNSHDLDDRIGAPGDLNALLEGAEIHVERDAPEDEDQEDEEEDEDGEMDENGDAMFETFSEMIDGQDDIIDARNPWGWDEAQLDMPMPRRHRHIRATGNMPTFLTRHLGAGGPEVHHIVGHPHRRHAVHGRPGVDDGINPLLQRSDRIDTAHAPGSRPPVVFPTEIDFGHFPPLPGAISGLLGGPEAQGGLGSHGRMLDAIMDAIHRGGTDGNVLRHGQLQININPGLPYGTPIPVSSSRPHRHEATPMFSSESKTTMTRWQEEIRLLFGSAYIELLPRVSKALLWKLVPPAQEEEKSRRKLLEEELEKARKEAEEQVKRKKEQEEREKAEKEAAETRAAAEAQAAAEADEGHRGEAGHEESVHGGDENTEPMEDVQATGEAETAPPANASGQSIAEAVAEPVQRVFTTIRGQQLDITGMAIDPEYLEALPEDMREEVIMQQYTSQRAQAQEEGGSATAVDPEFLNALPEDIREEIRQQEAIDRRRREREAARRQAVAQGGPAQAEEMDNDNFFASLDPALRRAILAEQPPEILQQLDPRHAAEGRAHARALFGYRGLPTARELREGIPARGEQTRDNKRQVVQMIDKSGVATLLRLMFLPQNDPTSDSIKKNLEKVLEYVSGHRQTRIEVVSLLLVLLKEGSMDVNAVERSLASLSLRAKSSNAPKTPQGLKHTLSQQPSVAVSEEMTPVVVLQQCLSALCHLAKKDPHVKGIFLKEVDTSSSTKPKSARKGKNKESKTTKYPINDLLGLLDRKVLMESPSCLQAFSELLSIVTSPLPQLMKKEPAQEKPEVQEHLESSNEMSSTVENNLQQEESHTQATASGDVAMSEAPTDDQDTGEHVTVTPNTADATPQQAKPDETPKAEEVKLRKSFEPPVIPEQNLRLLMNVFVGQDTSRDTFNCTSLAMNHLAEIADAKSTFISELTSHASSLSQVILTDLDELLPMIQEAHSGTDLQTIASAKFSSTNSDQSKMLRVLKALDSILNPRRQNGPGEQIPNDSTELDWSYETLSLGALWGKLSTCLTAIREKENIVSFATILLPLIESLMVVCKNTPLKEKPIPREAREGSVMSPKPETFSDIEDVFFTFTTEHRKILNEIIRQNPKLMQGDGSFVLLVKNPKVLDFDNKRSYFSKQLHSKHDHRRQLQPPLQLSVRRDHVFNDSFKALYFKSPDEMKYGKLNIRFHGEEGVDAGGVTREWFQVLARDMFNPDYCLWEPVAADKTTFHPSRLSGINDQHLTYFKFVGRIIGKALYEGRVLDSHFSRAVYKKILSKETNLRDMESLDIDYYKSLLWILENDITDVISEDFSVVSEDFGAERTVDLVENGRNIEVKEENKKEYVQALVEYRLSGSVADQLKEFLRGFHDIIPAELVAIFNEQELELLISGLPEIDVADWKANTEYGGGYNQSSTQVVWFWRLVNGMSNEERAKLLQFITGTSRVPLSGFSELEGLHGSTKTSIIAAPGATTQLPTSHTCFNQLDLPKYDSYEELRTRFMTAINLGAEYFGFA